MVLSITNSTTDATSKLATLLDDPERLWEQFRQLKHSPMAKKIKLYYDTKNDAITNRPYVDRTILRINLKVLIYNEDLKMMVPMPKVLILNKIQKEFLHELNDFLNFTGDYSSVRIILATRTGRARFDELTDAQKYAALLDASFKYINKQLSNEKYREVFLTMLKNDTSIDHEHYESYLHIRKYAERYDDTELLDLLKSKKLFNERYNQNY